MSIIQEDSYWWYDQSLPEQEQCMRALCIKCHEMRGIGWYWPGKKMGYGDYDLKCFFCNKQIHLRNKENDAN